MEKEKEKEGERIETINHLSHPHPLLFNDEEQSDKSKEARCSACLESLLGSSFSCGECDFHLHKKCAEAPLEIHSPFHCKHATLTLEPNPQWESSIFFCDLCKEKRKMFVYHCTSCHAYFDIKCAFLLHNIDENFCELKYITHEHPLTFIENPNDELKRAHCHWCQKPLVDSLYVCLDCRFYLHKKCAQLPTQLYHPCHRKHPLYLEDGYLDCKTCQKKHWSLFYRCLPCKFDIDIECALPRLKFVVECSEHSFIQLFRDDPFVCDACGIEGNHISYICSTCHIMIHKKCISLPRIIKTTWHHHEIIHNYFFQKQELEKHGCGICFGELLMKYGSYDCLKQDCNFVAHVDCAMEKYLATGQINDQDEESSENLASITCVIEMNQHGEATKIKHFSHEHDLTLDNKIKEDNDKRCDACMLSISTSFYYCSQCEFLLHKTCVELPRKKHHWFHESLFTLHVENTFQCGLCYHYCSGFAYHGNNTYKFCLRCVGISRIIPRQRHKHTLFFDFDLNKGQCNACGDYIHRGYKCKDCTFVLHVKCMALPQRARHKCDKHFLELTFHDENADLEEYYCDICEGQRDPNHWFYHCAICDNSAHPKCVFGKYPFLKKKIGETYKVWNHHHPLICVKKSYDICLRCGLPCQDIAPECKSCNFTVHFDCLDLEDWVAF